MAKAYEFHDLANIFPLIAGDRFDSLVESIKANGLREDIWLYEGKILDGRNRYLACQVADVEPRFQKYDGKNPVAFVIDYNLERRHLNESQRSIAAARLANMQQGQRADRSIDPSTTQPTAAKLLNVSVPSVKRAKVVLEKGTPEQIQAVERGERKVSQVANEIKATEKREALAEKAKATEAEPSDNVNIFCGDVMSGLAEIEDGFCRLVFADPPYNIGIDYGRGPEEDQLSSERYLEWVELWLKECVRVLTDDGSLWVMIGDEYADHFGIILRRIGVHRRSWIKWYETFGVNCSNNFNRCSRHIFYCVKDPKRFVFNADPVTRPSDRQTKYNDKRAASGGKIWDNVWEIPRLTGTCTERLPDFPTQLPLRLVEAIVGCASDPGDTVLDPFCGSGTTGIASLKQGRFFEGIELNERYWEMAYDRINAHC